MWETIKNWAMTQGLALGTNILVAIIILVIGILVFTMLERMVSFFTSVFEELMRRL